MSKDCICSYPIPTYTWYWKKHIWLLIQTYYLATLLWVFTALAVGRDWKLLAASLLSGAILATVNSANVKKVVEDNYIKKHGSQDILIKRDYIIQRLNVWSYDTSISIGKLYNGCYVYLYESVGIPLSMPIYLAKPTTLVDGALDRILKQIVSELDSYKLETISVDYELTIPNKKENSLPWK